MPQRKKKKGRMVKPFGDGGAANDGSHQSRQRLQQPASSKQHGLDLEQTMRKELSSLTLGTEGTDCLHGAPDPALMLPHPCVKIFYNFKLRDLWQGGERESTKFFHKRNVCTCLKEKCVQLRTQKNWAHVIIQSRAINARY
jgi:hypothetical protein